MSATDNEVKATEEPETTEETGPSSVMDVQITLPNKVVVMIPSVYVAESLAAFRQVLTDYQECAAFTCYSLHLRELVNADGSKTAADVACSDYTELATLVEPTTVGCNFDLIPGEYNLKRVQDQLKRTNEIFTSPPTTKGAVAVEAAKKVSDSAAQAKAAAAAAAEQAKALPKTEDVFKSIEFGNFYGEVLYRTGNVEAVAKAGRVPSSKPIADAIKSVFPSGWNPPPPQRKVRGDLLYIEVVTANEGTIYITAVPSGFYVNKCNRSYFDPSPAVNHCFSHELFDTLLKASATLKAAWTSAVTARAASQQAEAEAPTPLDVMAYMYSQGRGNLTVEAGVPQVQWNAYNVDAYKNFTEGGDASTRASENAHHSYNLFRTQQELSSLQGVEELGAPREWNDEIQSIRALKAGDANERVMKAKLEYKVMAEFAAACRATAVAISEGLIAPLSIGDPAQSEIYVYNGIFFSKAEDSKDSFKICNGDEAYKKSVARDVQNQRTIRALDIEGVGLILSAIIDYKGQRIIAQSILPGIFAQGENVARLMYGILDKEKMLTVKNSSLKIMQAIGAKLNIPVRSAKLHPFGELAAAAAATTEEEKEVAASAGMLEDVQASPIKVDEVDNVADARSPSTPHCGAIEGKVLRGSDGRDYVLEVMRLTPRDANYVLGEKGTGKVALAERADQDLAVTYILRRELIELFIQHKLSAQKQAMMMEAQARQKQLLAEVVPQPVAEGETPKEPSLGEEAISTLVEEFSSKMQALTAASLGVEVNPNCFLDFEFDVDAAVRDKDESTARELAAFLWDTVLPAVTKQVRDGDIQVRDNISLVKILHRHGVNMRYLGALLSQAAAEEKEDEDLLAQGKQKVHAMPLYWREMLTVELIARVSKYVLNGYFKSDAVYAAPAQTVASLLNHIVSLFIPTAAVPATAEVPAAAASATDKKGKKKKSGKNETAAPAPAAPVAAAAKTDASIFPVADGTGSREECLRSIQATAASRFCYHLHLVQGTDSTEADVAATAQFVQSRLSAATLIRRICQASGIQIATRKYNFSEANPFSAADILGLVPIAKSCEPDNLLQEFEEMIESSRAYLQDGNHAYAYEMAHQALNTITQITGPYHVHSSRAVDQVTNVLIAAGDFPAAAQYAQKGLAIAIQLHGFDSQESAMHHLKLGILDTELGNVASAAQHLMTSKYLLQLMTGEHHTELSTIFTRFATLYEEVGDFDGAWQCYVRAKFHTCDMMQICELNIALAATCHRHGHMHEALELQKQAYTVLKELLGERNEAQLNDVKATLENYLRAVNEAKIASNNIVNERLKEMVEKMSKTKLETSAEPVAAGQLSEQELFAAFAEIDARAKREKKNAKKATKKVADKAKK